MQYDYSPSDIARFWAKVDRDTSPQGCWLWTGATGQQGYGRFGVLRQQNRDHYVLRAHRVAWELCYGSIPDPLCVLHRCDVRRCVRPSHLFLGSRPDNTADMMAKGRGRVGLVSTSAKLSASAVRSIRRRYATGGVTMQTLASENGVTISGIHAIIHRLSYRDVS